ncbi:hypothetical protein [Mycobacterium palustre]|uniref:hypothetical protein n=1 Tax=Mycobacterium palustre TaxID=153971 RepID=UPI0035582187|nr:hypothetical protein [Mycobacterium palustre]
MPTDGGRHARPDVCVTGAECPLTVDGTPVRMWEPVEIPAGAAVAAVPAGWRRRRPPDPASSRSHRSRVPGSGW